MDNVAHGVPQGAATSPILFNAAISFIFDVLPQGSLIGYADDLVLMCEPNRVESLSNTDTGTVAVKWCSELTVLGFKLESKSVERSMVAHISNRVKVARRDARLMC